MECNQLASVHDRVVWADNVATTTWSWKHEPIGKARDDLLLLTYLLHSFVKHDRSSDGWYWSVATNGIFTTKKLSRVTDDETLGGNNMGQETIKNYLVPGKVEVFIWSVLRRRIPTHIELDRRGIDLDSLDVPYVTTMWNLLTTH
ncbi:uncharacterized protein [Rutidosis leptorrhynchoides]|uniref:uncharacterized protein n=1 Tax=Rutidosis leptorrhynchoides TaxID=125765 RepID=UPI003A99DA70